MCVNNIIFLWQSSYLFFLSVLFIYLFIFTVFTNLPSRNFHLSRAVGHRIFSNPGLCCFLGKTCLFNKRYLYIFSFFMKTTCICFTVRGDSKDIPQYMMHNVGKRHLCHLQTAKVQMRVHILAAWSGHSLFIDMYYNIHWFCKQAMKALISTHICPDWSGPALSANNIRALFMHCK